MANVLVESSALEDIADAIREKTGGSETYKPGDMGEGIRSIEGGSGLPVLNLLNGARIAIDSGGTVTHQYEFNPDFGTPDYIAILPALNVSAGVRPLSSGAITLSTKTTTQSYYFQSAVVSFTPQGLLTISNTANSSNSGMVRGALMLWTNTDGDATTIIIDSFYHPYYEDPCYLEDTIITLADKSNKKVQDITYNDELLVWNFDEGCYASAKPLWIMKKRHKVGYYHLTFESGNTLDVVGSNGKAHRLFDIELGQFVWSTDMVGHKTSTLNGEDTLISCEYVEKDCIYYNIITNYHINLYANGILTSCRYNNIYPIKDMKFIKEPRTIRPLEDYDVPKEWYDGLRLGEQVISVEDSNEYIQKCIEYKA